MIDILDFQKLQKFILFRVIYIHSMVTTGSFFNSTADEGVRILLQI